MNPATPVRERLEQRYATEVQREHELLKTGQAGEGYWKARYAAEQRFLAAVEQAWAEAAND